MSGYTPKNMVFDEEGRKKLMNGIAAISKAVKSTLGPGGNTVLIESPNHLHGITVTKDGVTVAKEVSLLDPVENLAVQMMRGASEKTAHVAGDGTTTAIVLTEAIIKEAYEKLMAFTNVNTTEFIKELNSVCGEVVNNLNSMSRKLSKKMLVDVATISSNNDKDIGALIAKTFNEVGADGVVTVEKSQTDDTYTETTFGIKLERGYTSPLFVNDQKKDECVLEDAYVLLTDHTIDNIMQIENILKPVINAGGKLLIMAECSQNVVNTLSANVARNGLSFCQIVPPQFGYKRGEIMSDIAIALGGKFFSESTGDDLSLIRMEDLGKVTKAIVSREETLIFSDAGDSEEIEGRVAELWGQHELAKTDRDFIESRIASLKGGIGVIYVGGMSDVEQKEKYDRVDDAVCAVKSALDEGILPGGGVGITQAFFKFLDKNTENVNSEVRAAAINCVGAALTSPMYALFRNAGLNEEEINVLWEKYMDPSRDLNKGYDIKNGQWGDMYKMGIIDPLKVTKNALLNAMSVATTILSTNAIITMARA